MKTVTARILRKSCLVFCQQNGIFVFSSQVINLDCQSWSINKDFLSFSDINEILVSSQYREDSLLPCLRGSQQRCHETEANAVWAWGPVRGREGQSKREEARWVSNTWSHTSDGDTGKLSSMWGCLRPLALSLSLNMQWVNLHQRERGKELVPLHLGLSVTFSQNCQTLQSQHSWDFPGGAVVKNLPANAGDSGSIPGPRRPYTQGSK